MKVSLWPIEKRQLEQLLEVMNNPFESIAKRRLAKSKFELIYNRAAKRVSGNSSEELTDRNMAAKKRVLTVGHSEGDINPSNH